MPPRNEDPPTLKETLLGTAAAIAAAGFAAPAGADEFSLRAAHLHRDAIVVDTHEDGVLGENFLRFFAKVEAVSRSLGAEPPSTETISNPNP